MILSLGKAVVRELPGLYRRLRDTASDRRNRPEGASPHGPDPRQDAVNYSNFIQMNPF
jgi:hypothetical protein